MFEQGVKVDGPKDGSTGAATDRAVRDALDRAYRDQLPVITLVIGC